MKSNAYIFALLIRAQVLTPVLYETMRTVSLFVKQPIAPYNEYLDPSLDFFHLIYTE